MNSQKTNQAPAELMEACLEIIAERFDDISPLVYQRFFAQFPDADALFGGTVGEMFKGGMIVDLLMQLLELAQGQEYHQNIERWICDHISYGVTQPMYNAMFEALIAALIEVMGDDWSSETRSAWDSQIVKIMAYVDRLYQKESR